MRINEQAEAIRAAKGGDRKAFERLYSGYRDKLYFFVLKNVGTKEAAEDIVSETFLDAMEDIGSLRAEEAFGSWLYSIAYRKCIRHNEDSSRTAHFETEEEQELAISDYGLNEPVQLPEDYAVSRQRKEQLKSVIDSLSPEQRSAVILYYYNEQTISEVAEALGISESAAGKRLFDARKKIKKKVEKLIRSGAFCAVPMGAMLESAIDKRYAAGAVKAGAAVNGISAVKIAAVSAAVALAVGVPVGLYAANNSWGGDTRDKSELVLVSSETDEPADDTDSKRTVTDADNGEGGNDSVRSGYVRIFPDEFLEDLTLSMTFRDFDETWYTVEGEELDEVKEMLSMIEGVPCNDPELSGWYMFDINMAEEISMVHGLIMTGNYICFDGVMYKNDEPDNGRELAEYFRANGKITATSENLYGGTAEFELVQYNENTRSGYAVSDIFGLTSFTVPEGSADAFKRSGTPHPGLILDITWSGNIAESYPSVLEDVSLVSVTGEREDFVSKHLNDVIVAAILSNDNDIQSEVNSLSDLNAAEKEGLSWLAENQLYDIDNIRDVSLRVLSSLDYRYGTNDGLPEYSLTADDGTVYQIDLSSRWVWKGNDYEADLSDDMVTLLETYKDEIGLQPVNWN